MEGTANTTDIVPESFGKIQHYLDLYTTGGGAIFISVFGLVTNSINIVVFIRQGLKDSVCISMLSLSVSDLGGNFFTILDGVRYIMKEISPPAEPVGVLAVLAAYAGWLRGVCLDTSALTTAYISVERCLSIVMPFQIKRMFTRSRVTKILLSLNIIIILLFVPVFTTQGVMWTESNVNGSTRLTIWISPAFRYVETYSIISTGIVLHTLIYITIIICTSLMIRGLRMNSEFRGKVQFGLERQQQDRTFHQSINNDKNVDKEGGKDHRMETGLPPRCSNKDRRVIRLVVLVAFVSITCTLPKVTMLYGGRIDLELKPGGRHKDLYSIFFGVMHLLEGLNASINMVVYLRASSKYKAVFLQTFCRRISNT